jgi:hypothetical protein
VSVRPARRGGRRSREGARRWTRDVDARLAAAGFTAVEYRGGYDPATPPCSTDRLVAVASRA